MAWSCKNHLHPDLDALKLHTVWMRGCRAAPTRHDWHGNRKRRRLKQVLNFSFCSRCLPVHLCRVGTRNYMRTTPKLFKMGLPTQIDVVPCKGLFPCSGSLISNWSEGEKKKSKMQFRGEKINNLVFCVPKHSRVGWTMGVQGRSSGQTGAEGSQQDGGWTEHWSLLAALCLHENVEGESNTNHVSHCSGQLVLGSLQHGRRTGTSTDF